jgi:hypothetical protein
VLTRSVLSGLTGLALATAGLLAAAPAGAAGPSGVQTTIVLQRNGDYRVTSTGHAPRSARLYLQDRFGEHDSWAVQASGRATTRGTFRLATTVDLTDGSYRVCVARPGKDTCSAGRQARIVKRDGEITLSDTAPQLVPVETATVTRGRLSNFLSGRPLTFQYRDPASGTWTATSSVATVSTDGQSFEVGLSNPFIGLPSKQGLRLRLVAKGNAWVRTVTKEWSVDSYAQRSLATLPVSSGTMIQGTVVYAFQIGSPASSAAVSPTNTVALTVPAGCGRVQAGVSQDLSHSGLGPYSAVVQRNGVTVWSFDSATPASTTFSVDVTVGDTVSLGVTFDPGHPDWRPWFVTPFQPAVTAPKLPFALCAAP